MLAFKTHSHIRESIYQTIEWRTASP
uniref:Uncharacterized protein n=1 Tax=Anguilla anguilla TaxID=7936 RepID=A0A0E9SPL3_ANGAN